MPPPPPRSAIAAPITHACVTSHAPRGRAVPSMSALMLLAPGRLARHAADASPLARAPLARPRVRAQAPLLLAATRGRLGLLVVPFNALAALKAEQLSAALAACEVRNRRARVFALHGDAPPPPVGCADPLDAHVVIATAEKASALISRVIALGRLVDVGTRCAARGRGARAQHAGAARGHRHGRGRGRVRGIGVG